MKNTVEKNGKNNITILLNNLTSADNNGNIHK